MTPRPPAAGPKSVKPPAVSPALLAQIRRDLLGWYARHQRVLPWRSKTPNPYHVLVSEAMLQQTQVATVIDYFNRFIQAFPTVQHLAEADVQEVLRLWQGLGYYRRAHNLHAAAGQIVEQYGGCVPSKVEQLLGLPGVGRYTAGAVASIAFGQAAPIVDGNVARVLARWFAIDQPIDAHATRTQLWQLAQRLVCPQQPGDFNQAMMELGALVCTPAKPPACLMCPMRASCQAFKKNMADTLPTRSPRRPPRPVDHHVLAVHRRGRYLFVQRPARGLWSSMWQLPTAETPKQPLSDWLTEQTGLAAKPLKQVSAFTHQTTHRTIRFTLWHAAVQAGGLKPQAGIWRELDCIDDLPLSNPQRKAAAIIANTRLQSSD